MVVFDTTTLLLLLNPNTRAPKDSNGGIITHPRERIDGLVASFARSRTKIIVPTPSLAEALVWAGQAAGQQYLAKIRNSTWFRIEPFDERAAVELASMTKAAIDAGKARHLGKK